MDQEEEVKISMTINGRDLGDLRITELKQFLQARGVSTVSKKKVVGG